MSETVIQENEGHIRKRFATEAVVIARLVDMSALYSSHKENPDYGLSTVLKEYKPSEICICVPNEYVYNIVQDKCLKLKLRDENNNPMEIQARIMRTELTDGLAKVNSIIRVGNHRQYEWDRGKETFIVGDSWKVSYHIYNLHGINMCTTLNKFKEEKLDPRHHIVIFDTTPVTTAVGIIKKFGFDKYGCLDRDCIYTIADYECGHKKFDDDKLKYDSIPPEFIRMCAEIVSGNITVDLSLIDKNMLLALGSVLTYGAKKYEKENWRLCQELGRYRGAAMRHFEAYRAGEVNKAEGEFHHLWHCLTNIAILIGLEAQKENQNETNSN